MSVSCGTIEVIKRLGSFSANSLLRGKAAERANALRKPLMLVQEGLTSPNVPALALPVEKEGGGVGVGYVSHSDTYL